MRSRSIREGSVGLLILLGLGLFGIMVLWLRGFNLGSRSYQATFEFSDVAGMRPGSPVRYRGVAVGKVLEIQPGVEEVAVVIEIDSSDTQIPRDSFIQVNQAGLIGETSVDILPIDSQLTARVATNPLAPDCEGNGIICNGDRLDGAVGANFNELITATVRLTNLISDPAFFSELRGLAQNTSDAAAGVAVLAREVTRLSQSVEQELSTFSGAAVNTSGAVQRSAEQIGLTAAGVNTLLIDNRTALRGTLENINRTTSEVQDVIVQVRPMIENGEFFENLEQLSANAAAASANLRDLTEAVGSSENALLLQETLDAARATFQNAQKITADLDDLTGDPSFRENVRELVNGLSNLVSYTHDLEYQRNLALNLEQVERLNSEPVSIQPSTELPLPEPQISPSTNPTEPIARRDRPFTQSRRLEIAAPSQDATPPIE